MSRTDGDSHSVCSSRPSVSNPMVKKRSFHRFSIRQLFYASPLMGHPRRLNKKKSSSETDARSESSLSTHTAADRDCFGGTSGALGAAGMTSTAHPRGGESARVGNGCQASSFATQTSQSSDSTVFSSQTLLKPSGDIECQLLVCPLCLSEMPPECFPKLSTCPHRSCQDCLKQYLKIEISESRVNISCPECAEPIHPTDIRAILNDVITMNKYEEYTLRRILAKDPDTRWCPAPDCGFAVIAAGCASCPRLQCDRPGCQTYFCYHCKQEWHPNQTCDAARAQRSPNIRASSVSFGQDSAQRDDIKPCPRCQVLIVKMDDGSCNHMTCAVCGAEFCWLCMKEISDLHYLSPSGCTFWGKKPWSRKKKILWQLGTLVGAPVGIGLVAGIAVPAIIIGVPVWVGRKLHTRYENSSKHKRNLAITGGVTASIIISPILASLAVGIGVPILLAYVYGVVPISLCRSGGCGVSTTSSGVRIDFNDENDMTSANGGQTQDGQSVDARAVNPSIGEVSFGMSASLSMGSGSHLDRMGVIRDGDRESASNTAIAGTSLTGSMSSGMVTGLANHKLEVMADVASNKRFSFSSETASATVSLSERSTTMSMADDASTRALAGSITGSRDPSASFTPVEVHVDATASSHGGSQDSVIGHHKGHDSVSDYGHDEAMSFSRVGSRGRHRLASNDRQMASNFDTESCSLWSRDDTNSERVRFDENVSFIDDMSSDDYQYNLCSGGGYSSGADAVSNDGVPCCRRSGGASGGGPSGSICSGGASDDVQCRPRVSICRSTAWQSEAVGSDRDASVATSTTEPLEEYSDCIGSAVDGGEYSESFILPSSANSTTTKVTSSALKQQQVKTACDVHIPMVVERIPTIADAAECTEVVTEAPASGFVDLVEVVTGDERLAVHEPIFYDAVEQS